MSKLIRLANAAAPAEAMRLKIILNRANIPYTTFNELNFIFTAQGPIEFYVPEIFFDEAITQLETAFEVNMDDLPEFCPACSAPSLEGLADCPGCGLFLG